MNARGDVKLGDFGCVKKLKSNDDYLTRVIGSVRYYSPEKWLQYPVQYGTKSDIWSFGISMFEILTGHIETDDHDNGGAGYIEAPKLRRHKFSEEACDFIDKCLTKDPNERWSATQLLKHPWLDDACKITICDKINDDDLKFIVESLIEYYSQRHFLDPTLSRNSTLRDKLEMKNNTSNDNNDIENNDNENNNGNNNNNNIDIDDNDNDNDDGFDGPQLSRMESLRSLDNHPFSNSNLLDTPSNLSLISPNSNESLNLNGNDKNNNENENENENDNERKRMDIIVNDFSTIEARIRGDSQVETKSKVSHIASSAMVMKRMSSHGIARTDPRHWEDMSSVDETPRKHIGYSDEERIRNIAKHTGCTPKQVESTIRYYVGNVRSKLIKRTSMSMSSSQFMSPNKRHFN